MSPHDPRTPPSDRSGADRFDAALRAWASREPRTPAAEAARRVLERLPEREARRGHRSRWWLAAAVLAVAVFGWVAVLGRGGDRSPSRAGRAAVPVPAGAGSRAPAGAAPVAPRGDVLMIELDPETTLYLNLGNPGDPS